MHKIAKSPINTRFLRLCIYSFCYFEKEKQKINSLKTSGFQCGKPTFSASGYIYNASYILTAVKVIFRLSTEVASHTARLKSHYCKQ